MRLPYFLMHLKTLRRKRWYWSDLQQVNNCKLKPMGTPFIVRTFMSPFALEKIRTSVGNSWPSSVYVLFTLLSFALSHRYLLSASMLAFCNKIELPCNLKM